MQERKGAEVQILLSKLAQVLDLMSSGKRLLVPQQGFVEVRQNQVVPRWTAKLQKKSAQESK